MKVIFTQNIKGIARIGDIKNVADGYARNFLLPKMLARQANVGSIKEAEALKMKFAASEAERRMRAERLTQELKDLTLETSAEANEDGHLYGSIGVDDISKFLKLAKFDISENEINLAQPIKAIGGYTIELELSPEIKTSIKLKVFAK